MTQEEEDQFGDLPVSGSDFNPDAYRGMLVSQLQRCHICWMTDVCWCHNCNGIASWMVDANFPHKILSIPTLDVGRRRKTIDDVFFRAVSCQSGQVMVGVPSQKFPLSIAQMAKMLAKDENPTVLHKTVSERAGSTLDL